MKKIKDLKVIGVPWHIAHQYEIAKLFKSYDMLMNPWRDWDDRRAGFVKPNPSRPVPPNMKMVYTLDPKDYDLAILHVDQQTIEPNSQKWRLFTHFEEITRGMNRVVINHMTPYSDKYESPDVITMMQNLVGDIPMVTNSKQAAEQWGWGTPIIHGMELEEWQDLPKEPRIVVSVSTDGMRLAYRRELLNDTIEILEKKGIPIFWIQSDIRPKSFEEYREYLGRSLIYFHPLWQSPMARARTEAMLSGCCVVSTKHHDWHEYITEGENGYLVIDNPRVMAEKLQYLLEHPQEARAVGKRGREFARKTFNHDRWANDWQNFIKSLGYLGEQ